MDIFCHENAFDSLIPSLKNTVKDILYFPKRVWRWLAKSVQYSIFLWDDYDWDWIYILKLLRFKLKRQLKIIQEEKYLSDKSKDPIIEQLTYCITLLDRIVDYDYGEEFDRIHREKWGEAKYDYNPVGDGYFKMDITYPNAETLEDLAQAKKERLENLKQEEYLRNKDIQDLFEYIGKHIRRWWG